MGEVATGPKNHQALGRDNPLLAESYPQWIGEHSAHECLSGAHGLTGLAPSPTAWPTL